MAKKNKRQAEDTNYSFLFQCMAALTTAAIVTAGIIAAATLKSAAVSAIAAQTLLASAFVFTPVFPMALIAISLVFVLPFLFGCNNNTSTVARTTRSSNYTDNGNFTFYTSPSVYTPYPGYPIPASGSSVYINDNHSHRHPSSQGTVHGHGGANTDRHDGAINRHGHGHF
ncbi:hypothetical protein [Fluoribacter dumoffii]|uniref:Uncharacterized protein n=1 Tax=Fluoribacter dumoffii TaxID=463 RepID=A0A377GA57_9GAMM|nr:hypothetical protein [Fluoribacter dumoffii]KTC88953.1 hypothetical protein Ldum_3211 [Fluoribacter dumoffii NY 23]STO21643.1 Uncharacterised protein [Fluoribacter dumoffii]